MEETRTIAVDPGGIPDELKALDRWVLWRIVYRGGKPTKMPFCAATGRAASSTDSATWSTFGAVLEAYDAKPDCWSGIGFVFDKEDKLVGIDLDGVIADGAMIADWPPEYRAKCSDVPTPTAIVQSLGSYTEFSPSGTGLHVIIRGSLPTGGNRRGNKSAGVELYDHGRFFCVTGRRFNGTPPLVNEVNGELARLHAAVFGKKTGRGGGARVPEATPANDSEIVTAAREATNGAKFSALWSGDFSGYPSPSEADLALCSMLAFWTGPDPARIGALMRQSGLARAKWDANKNYLPATISKALEGRTEFFNTPQRSARPSDGRGWRVTIVRSKPPTFRLFAPLWDGFVVLTAKQILSFSALRLAAMTQRPRAFIPPSLRGAWNGSSKGPGLAEELLADADEIDAPEELHRDKVIAEQVRDHCAKMTRRRRLDEITIADLPARDVDGNVMFLFGQLLESLNDRAFGDDRVTRPELLDVLSEMGATDRPMGRGSAKRKVKFLPHYAIAGGANTDGGVV